MASINNAETNALSDKHDDGAYTNLNATVVHDEVELALKKKRRNQICATGSLLVSILAAMIAVITIFAKTDRSVPFKANLSDDTVFTAAGNTPNSTLEVLSIVNGIDLSKFTVTASAEPLPYLPPLVSKDGLHVTKPFTLAIDTSDITYSSANVVKSVSANSIPILSGSIDLYPFDSYKSNITVFAHTGTIEQFFNGSSELGIAVYPAYFKAYGWSFTFDRPQPSDYAGLITYTVNFKRSGLFLVYPVFMIVSIWVIAVIALYAAIKLSLFTPSPVPPPIVAAYVALLFAIPAYRKTAPGDPPIGCALDFLAFYWALVIAVVNVVLVMLKFSVFK